MNYREKHRFPVHIETGWFRPVKPVVRNNHVPVHLQENFVTDKSGRKVAVQIPIKTYEKLVADSEDWKTLRNTAKPKPEKASRFPMTRLLGKLKMQTDDLYKEDIYR